MSPVLNNKRLFTLKSWLVSCISSAENRTEHWFSISFVCTPVYWLLKWPRPRRLLSLKVSNRSCWITMQPSILPFSCGPATGFRKVRVLDSSSWLTLWETECGLSSTSFWNAKLHHWNLLIGSIERAVSLLSDLKLPTWFLSCSQNKSKRDCSRQGECVQYSYPYTGCYSYPDTYYFAQDDLCWGLFSSANGHQHAANFCKASAACWIIP